MLNLNVQLSRPFQTKYQASLIIKIEIIVIVHFSPSDSFILCWANFGKWLKHDKQLAIITFNIGFFTFMNKINMRINWMKSPLNFVLCTSLVYIVFQNNNKTEQKNESSETFHFINEPPILIRIWWIRNWTLNGFHKFIIFFLLGSQPHSECCSIFHLKLNKYPE